MAATKFILPSTMRKFVVKNVTTKFREAVELVTCPVPSPGSGQVLVKNCYVGINASDINYTAKRYDPTLVPPFDCGFEGIGQIVSVGAGCMRSSVGQSVAYMMKGAFTEYIVLSEKAVFPIPTTSAQYLSLVVTGLTSAISLDKVGEITSTDTILISAAAGGAGMMAVQWAKIKGCHVIGLCSSDEKCEFLRSIGCDRPINISKENLGKVLKSEYPKGIDVVYESIGGEVFNTCLENLAVKGRLIIIGYISGYETTGLSPVENEVPKIVRQLLVKSQSLRGFMLFTFASDQPEYFMKLTRLLDEGKLKCVIDLGERIKPGGFRGIESIPDAVEYLYSRKNIGKIVVAIDEMNVKL